MVGKENGKKLIKEQVRDSGAKGQGLGHHTQNCPNKMPLVSSEAKLFHFPVFPYAEPN